ncbi:nuclear transport factor 2 family protein [Pimelobacter simplex]|uniref:nuclear transport factor 2 family protein n=1 Tax=Nocardioides simplex TaxID=2045 RepID=UPI003AAAA048
MSAEVKAAVARYLDAVAGGSPAAIAALYAPDATLEDPVGADLVRGRAAIEEFYGALAGAKVSTELLAVRAIAGQAAFSFRVTTDAGDQQYVVEPIDVMTFDADGQITSMRAFWAPEDMVVTPA